MEAFAVKYSHVFLCLIASASISGFSFEDEFGLNLEIDQNETTPAPEPVLIQRIKSGTIEVQIDTGIVFLIITRNDGTSTRNVLQSKINNYIVSSFPTYCGPNKICLVSNKFLHVIIETDPASEIISVHRQIYSRGILTDCYQLEDGTEWYGGPELYRQKWPVQDAYFEEFPYVPTEVTSMAITERYWLSSKGTYIFVNETDPLFLDQNNFKDKHLCFVAKNVDPYRKRVKVTLQYKIGVFDDPKSAHLHAVNTFLGKPEDLPDERMIEHPVWSTWAKYKMNINDVLVSTFADEIIANHYNNSQLEIDDKWESCYGSATFDPLKFRNVPKLLSSLKKRGFRVTLWVHPFINKRCEPAYSEAYHNKYLVHSIKGRLKTSWWQGKEAGVIDFTNPKAVKWWVGRLQKLRKLGIDSFKFDAGETSWLPQVPALNNDDFTKQPGIFTRSYVSTMAELFGNQIEVRVGWGTQNLPIFVRMLDKDSKWTGENGLPTLITTLLQMNMNGYTFVMPDMVGGNGYGENALSSSTWPSKNLFIRWLQANTFMPCIQYSFAPWDYDKTTNDICKKYTDLHAKMSSRIIRLMKNTVRTGAPLNPPVWWVDPKNPDGFKINDEFLLGEEILVAPVIEKDALSRDIYIPAGRWEDANDNRSYVGPLWLRDYPAPLHVLPYFYKIA